jgi:hypothetical protein
MTAPIAAWAPVSEMSAAAKTRQRRSACLGLSLGRTGGRVDAQALAGRRLRHARLLDRVHELVGQQAEPLDPVGRIAAAAEDNRVAHCVRKRVNRLRRRGCSLAGVHPHTARSWPRRPSIASRVGPSSGAPSPATPRARSPELRPAARAETALGRTRRPGGDREGNVRAASRRHPLRRVRRAKNRAGIKRALGLVVTRLRAGHARTILPQRHPIVTIHVQSASTVMRHLLCASLILCQRPRSLRRAHVRREAQPGPDIGLPRQTTTSLCWISYSISTTNPERTMNPANKLKRNIMKLINELQPAQRPSMPCP